MNILLPIVVGVLVAGGLYLMMRRSMVKLVIGLSLLSHATNLAIFAAGDLRRGQAPIIPDDAKTLGEGYSDPLPQALILTAIVIAFGLQAFAIALVVRTYIETGTDDVDELKTTEG